MRIADSQVTKSVLQALHSKDTGVAERLTVAERLSKMPRNSEQYKVAMMAYAAQECGKKFEAFEAGSARRWLMKPNNKLYMMFCAARDCGREIEKENAQVINVKTTARIKVVPMADDAAVQPVIDVVKQMLDQEVNARMEEWFAEAKD